MTIVRVLLAAVLALAVVTVPASTPAYACSCAGSSLAEHVDRDVLVVRGTIAARDTPGLSGLLRSGGDDVVYRVDVERVYLGTSGPETAIHSPASGASCGLEVAVGEEYVLIASSRDGRLHGSLCGGTAPASAAYVAEVERLLGTGTPPDAAIAPPDTPPDMTGWMLGGGGLLVLAAAAFGFRRRRTR